LRCHALAPGRVLRLQIDRGQGDRSRIGDALHRPTVLVQERRSQYIVAAHDLGQGSRQRGDVERALEPLTDGQRVSPGAGFELVEKPEALLRERQRRPPLVGAQPRQHLGLARRQLPAQRLGQHPLWRAAMDLIAFDSDSNAQQAQLRDEFRRGARH
jgi:hypothetical protein